MGVSIGDFSVAFSPDGKTLVSSSSYDGLKLWEVASGKQLHALNHPGLRVVAFSPDGKTLASGSADHTVRIWDVASGNELRHLVEPAVGVQPPAVPTKP
jgi:WD40 repeat protein